MSYELTGHESFDGAERQPRGSPEILVRPARVRGRAAAELPLPGLLALCRQPADPARHPPREAERGTRRRDRSYGVYRYRPAGHGREAAKGRGRVRTAPPAARRSSRGPVAAVLRRPAW